MKTNLVWFRNDLRIYDNAALYNACISNDDKVIGLFIATSTQWKDYFFSPKKISFIYQNLISLEKSLLKLNIYLNYHDSTDFLSSIDYLIYFCKKNQVNNLFYNYQYENHEINRDNMVKKNYLNKVFVQKDFTTVY